LLTTRLALRTSWNVGCAIIGQLSFKTSAITCRIVIARPPKSLSSA
jgi:hypothetical protein